MALQQKEAFILGKVNGQPMQIGTWWWNLHGIWESVHNTEPGEAIDLLIQNNITNIYLDVSGMYDDAQTDGDPKAATFSQVRSFIRTCNLFGISVSALTGASRDTCKRWIDPERGYPEIKGFFDKIEFFNAFSEEDERFIGVHIDVEPHSISDFPTNRAFYFNRYIALMNYISERAHQSGLRVETDICANFLEEDVVSVNGKNVKLLDAIFDACDLIAVMAYRHSAERQMDFGTRHYIPYAEKYNTILMVGSETMPPCDDLTIDDIPPSITYATVGWDKMVEEITKLQHILLDETSATVGISVHHVHSWIDLVRESA